MTPSLPLLVLIACSALSAIACEGEHRRRAFYVLKPLTTLLILALLWLQPGADDDYRLRMSLAMLACVAGDIALTGHSDRAFVLGLGSFLIGHLIFVAAFLRGVPGYGLPAWSALALPYAGAGIAVLWPRVGALRAPVLVYVGVLVAMWLAAAMRVQALGGNGATLALTGASVFIVSDSLLAWQRFVGPYRGADAAVLSSYWLAMTLLALSAAGSAAA